jgi:hypothetical protein
MATLPSVMDRKPCMTVLLILPAVPVECEVLTSLMRNLRQEKSLALMMRGFFFGQELSILQVGWGWVGVGASADH